jgi:hypothetical protein
MRSITSLIAGLVALATVPTAEASPKHQHQHNTACKHQNTVVVRPGGYSTSTNSSNYNHNHKHSSTSVVIVTSTPTYTYYPYYGYRQYYYVNPTPTYAQPPQPRPQPPVAQKPVVQNTLIREVGARFVGGGSVEGEQTALVGAGAYLRLRNPSRFLGFEASIDSMGVLDAGGNAIANQVPVQAAALLYLNPQAPLRLFGLAGGGVALEQSAVGTSQNVVAQIGGGLELDFSSRATFTLDVRGLGDPRQDLQECSLPRTIASDETNNFALFDFER